MYDLRSDTVTKPSKEVIQSALDAELGDDEYIEDPTVNNLENQCAELLSFEKGLFVSSGLMGNQISLLIHNDPGTEVITPHDSHIKNYEHGAAAFLSRVQFRDAQNIDGEVDLEFVEKLILKSKIHKPQIKTISIENTHLASGGSVVSFDSIKSLSDLARRYDLKLHVDGARIWHAILEDNNKNYGDYCDSLTFCFSKALGAPIGSMLLGSKEFIKEAREYRKKLGGGMRQIGIIASAAKFALIHREELLKDHEKAQYIYKKLIENREKMDPIHEIEYKGTNMIFLSFQDNSSANKFIEKLEENNIKTGLIKKNIVRIVLHKDVNEKDLDEIVETVNYSSS